jgi:hypothetical protein
MLVVGIVTPSAVVGSPLAGLVPSLDEIVVHVGGCRPAHLDIDIVAVPLTVTGRPDSPSSEVDPADECHL